MLSSKDLAKEGNANIKEFKDNTNPEYVGPGTWDVIHKLAYQATTKEKQVQFVELMEQICDKFNCINCRNHCQEYIKLNPMDEYFNRKMEIDGKVEHVGLFIWSWRFHNVVNKRLQKPLMSWDTAYNLYKLDSNNFCSLKCINAK